MSQEVEIWKDIKGYEGIYQISNMARVKSLSRIRFSTSGIIYPIKERICKTVTRKGLYTHINLCKERVKKTNLIHRLIAIAFIPNPDNKPEVNHINGIKSDNRIENLEWCTKSENELHAFATNLKVSIIGEDNVGSKLSNAQVSEIRSKYIPRITTTRKLASEYGISCAQISLIINFKARKYG